MTLNRIHFIYDKKLRILCLVFLFILNIYHALEFLRYQFGLVTLYQHWYLLFLRCNSSSTTRFTDSSSDPSDNTFSLVLNS